MVRRWDSQLPGQAAAPDQVMPLGEQQPPVPQDNGGAPPSDD